MSKKIEFLTRWQRLKATDDNISKEQRELNRIINGEEEQSNPLMFMAEIEYEYTRMFLDLEDIKAVNEYDKEHTVIRTYSGDVYTVKGSYRAVKYMIESEMGIVVKSFDNFRFDDQLLNKVEKINKILTEPEQIEPKTEEQKPEEKKKSPKDDNKNQGDIDNLLNLL